VDFLGVGILEALLILVVALLVLGPKRLPQVAQQLGVWIHQARASVAEARESMLADLDIDEPAKPGTALPEGPKRTPEDSRPSP